MYMSIIEGNDTFADTSSEKGIGERMGSGTSGVMMVTKPRDQKLEELN